MVRSVIMNSTEYGYIKKNTKGCQRCCLNNEFFNNLITHELRVVDGADTSQTFSFGQPGKDMENDRS